MQLLTQHPKHHCKENQSGATAFFSLELLGLKELLTEVFANWHRSTWGGKRKQTKMRSVNLIKGEQILAHSENKKVEQNLNCLQIKYRKNEIHQGLHQSRQHIPIKS